MASNGTRYLLFALVVEEGGEACILSLFIEIIINPDWSQEIITRTFTRPYLRGAS